MTARLHSLQANDVQKLTQNWCTISNDNSVPTLITQLQKMNLAASKVKCLR